MGAVSTNHAQHVRWLLDGWTGTRVENWITREFYALIAEEYPEGDFPQ